MNSSTTQPTSNLTDAFGRVHTSLRISVTDRCNIRCFYCMPEGNLTFQPREQLLTFEEIVQFVTVCVRMGVTKYRLTGGEPLVRKDLEQLVQSLVAVPGVEEVALTTNGILLAQHARALQAAGLHRLNVSLDTLNAARFEQIARRPGLDQVLEGIATAQQVGFRQIRVNSIAVRGMTEAEILELVTFAAAHDLHLRFIEYMPLDAEAQWTQDQVLSAHDMRQIIRQQLGELVPLPRPDPAQPAVDYQLTTADGSRSRVGFISSVTEPFCGTCNRLRLTADGQVRNCLFSSTEWDARALLRSGGTDLELRQLLLDCVAAKKPGHGIDEPGFLRPQRAMYQIGG